MYMFHFEKASCNIPGGKNLSPLMSLLFSDRKMSNYAVKSKLNFENLK